jgi:DNA-binding MarR family transcriptional regulator
MLGVGRHSAYRGLKRLEEANLVKVERHPGRNPIVTVLDFRGDDETS